VPALPALITTTAESRIMVTGQVQLTLACSVCPLAPIDYQLVRNGTGISPIYRVTLSPTHPDDVATLSIMDTVPAGGWEYQIRVASVGSVGFTAANAVLNVQVLGSP
jgi:hypothetical protein